MRLLLGAVVLIQTACAQQRFDGMERVIPQRIPVVSPAMIFAAPGTTQAIAQATPISIMTTRRVLGKGHSIGLWNISICSHNGPINIPREQVLMGSALPFIPNTLAEDIVGRQVSSDPTTMLGKNGNTALSLGTTLATGVGLIAKSPNTLYAGVAASVAQLIINTATAQAPSATPYFSQLLPPVVPLMGTGACGSWYLFSSPVRGAQVSMWEVRY